MPASRERRARSMAPGINAHLDLLDELAFVGVRELLQEAVLHDVGEDWSAALRQSDDVGKRRCGTRTDVIFAELWLAQVAAENSNVLARWPQKAHRLRAAIGCA